MERQDIEVSFPGGKKVQATYKGHVIMTDQPLYQGGADSAPSPFDLFLSSIAACSGYYVLSFCQERRIPTEKARLVMKTERDPETRMIVKVSITIHLPPEFPEKYRKAVVRAVDACSVKAHILNPPSFEIETTVGG